MNRWTVMQGMDTAYTAVANDADGNPIAYTGAERLAGTVWPGNDQPAVFAVAPVWLTPGLGLTQVSIAGTATAALTPGTYYVRLTVTDNTGTHDYFFGELVVTYASGAGTARPTYNTRAHMIKFAPWIEELQVVGDLAGFLDQRADAREWLDDTIIANWRGASLGQFGYHSAAAYDWGAGGPRRTLMPSDWLRQQLNLNYLMIRPRTIRICAYYSIAQVCVGLIGKGGDYAKYGAGFLRSAMAEACKYTAELDLNSDGKCELPIPISSTNTIYT